MNTDITESFIAEGKAYWINKLDISIWHLCMWFIPPPSFSTLLVVLAGLSLSLSLSLFLFLFLFLFLSLSLSLSLSLLLSFMNFEVNYVLTLRWRLVHQDFSS